jgi:hypothetical protein
MHVDVWMNMIMEPRDIGSAFELVPAPMSFVSARKLNDRYANRRGGLQTSRQYPLFALVLRDAPIPGLAIALSELKLRAVERRAVM